MILLTDTNHSNPVKTMQGDEFLFAKGENLVLSNNPQLSSIFGCPAKLIGHQKRPWNEAEKKWQDRYNEGKPREWENRVWTVYEVDWKQFAGEPIPGTHLLEAERVSSNSLSDASIAHIAVDKEAGLVVSYMHTSYWRSDAGDSPAWRKSLFQKFPAAI